MISCVIVGLGNIGFKYDKDQTNYIQTHFRAIKRNKEFKLLACIDLEVPPDFNQDIPFYKKFSELKEEANLVVIAVNSQSHLAVMEEVLSKDHVPRLILLEKPAGDNYLETSTILKLCENKNANVHINFFREANINKLKTLILDLGEPKHINIMYTGTLQNIGYHFISFVSNLLNEKISCVSKNTYFEAKHYFGLMGKANISILELTNSSLINNEVSIFFLSGKLTYENENNVLKIYRAVESSLYDGESNYVLTQKISLGLETSMKPVYKNIQKWFEKKEEIALPSIRDFLEIRENFEF